MLRVPGNHDMEIIPRVLAFGEHAKVVSPERCRDVLVEILRRLLETYGKS
jgi:predicted DNA-binding transcriptional regulator YafY